MQVEVNEKDICKVCKHLRTDHQKGFNVIDMKSSFGECKVTKKIDGVEFKCNCKQFIPS